MLADRLTVMLEAVEEERDRAVTERQEAYDIVSTLRVSWRQRIAAAEERADRAVAVLREVARWFADEFQANGVATVGWEPPAEFVRVIAERMVENETLGWPDVELAEEALREETFLRARPASSPGENEGEPRESISHDGGRTFCLGGCPICLAATPEEGR